MLIDWLIKPQLAFGGYVLLPKHLTTIHARFTPALGLNLHARSRVSALVMD